MNSSNNKKQKIMEGQMATFPIETITVPRKGLLLHLTDYGIVDSVLPESCVKDKILPNDQILEINGHDISCLRNNEINKVVDALDDEDNNMKLRVAKAIPNRPLVTRLVRTLNKNKIERIELTNGYYCGSYGFKTDSYDLKNLQDEIQDEKQEVLKEKKFSLLLQAVQGNISVTTISIQYVHFEISWYIFFILNCLPNLESLRIDVRSERNSSYGTDLDNFQNLGLLGNIRKLFISGFTCSPPPFMFNPDRIPNMFCNALGQLKRLEHFSWEGFFTCSNAYVMQNDPERLQSILEALNGLPLLRRIEFDPVKTALGSFPPSAAQYLVGSPKLVDLRLSNLGFCDQGFGCFLRGLPQLRNLKTLEMKRVDFPDGSNPESFASALSQTSCLTSLKILDFCNFQDGSTGKIIDWATNYELLTTLYIDGVYDQGIGNFGRVVELVRKHKTLQYLKVNESFCKDKNPATAQDGIALLSALRANTALQKMDVSATFTSPGLWFFKELVNLIERNETLRRLNISEMEGGDWDVSIPESLSESLLRAFWKNCSLHFMNLYRIMPSEFKAKLFPILCLNQEGRKQWDLSDPSQARQREDFFIKIITSWNDYNSLDKLFYFLKNNVDFMKPNNTIIA